MANLIFDIEEFHEKFEIQKNAFPGPLDQEMQAFRIRFMMEELEEYIHATVHKDLEQQADALIDLMYVVLGTAHLHGFPIAKLWDDVHGCNMNKIRVESSDQSKRKSSFDVIKPDGWVGPQTKKILEEEI